jgi:hypothetical protein
MQIEIDADAVGLANAAAVLLTFLDRTPSANRAAVERIARALEEAAAQLGAYAEWEG